MSATGYLGSDAKPLRHRHSSRERVVVRKDPSFPRNSLESDLVSRGSSIHSGLLGVRSTRDRSCELLLNCLEVQFNAVEFFYVA